MADMDASVFEALISRLCHDLAGPAGAIRNGLELIEECSGAGTDPEAVGLIADSADRLTRRLRLYRLAWGRAGSIESPHLLEDLRLAAGDWLNGSKVSLDWPSGAMPPALGNRMGLAHVLLCAILIAEECLPRGGTMQVAGVGDGHQGAIEILARGTSARVSPETAAALSADGGADGEVAGKPQAVHSVALRYFVGSYDFAPPEIAEISTGIRLRLTW